MEIFNKYFISIKIRSLTLEGAMNGVSFYVTPDWSKLFEPRVWGDAASQTFYSFGLACNSLVTFASYSNVSKGDEEEIVQHLKIKLFHFI